MPGVPRCAGTRGSGPAGAGEPSGSIPHHSPLPAALGGLESAPSVGIVSKGGGKKEPSELQAFGSWPGDTRGAILLAVPAPHVVQPAQLFICSTNQEDPSPSQQLLPSPCRWGILFSHPRDFTPVCTTELGRAAKLAPEFSKRNVKMIALSIDSVQDHLSWCKDINAYNGEQPAEKLPFPIIADKNRELAVKLGMLDPDELDKDGMPLTARVVFVFGPDKKLKLSILYPATTGRNFDEILRVVDSLQLTAYKKVATPVDWKPGDSVMVVPTLPDEEAKKLFPKGIFTKELPSGKKYLRYTPQPE
ncbi:peroxiredoxin-6 [Cyanistes caeruleus]|nr:peroxiredoxin-6 [Cyanistes caeruleus]